MIVVVVAGCHGSTTVTHRSRSTLPFFSLLGAAPPCVCLPALPTGGGGGDDYSASKMSLGTKLFSAVIRTAGPGLALDILLLAKVLDIRRGWSRLVSRRLNGQQTLQIETNIFALVSLV